ncbi:CDP-glucose 4,6-dehydratase [Bordetella bronchialis]|uniref:CDP-glucose 4,6-dehydratase n=1 Tax=Bordetella bronchialis TaxID=463025 RepID=A0A193G4V7_9BORD|nr:CDP-glucose 4,6-dehydratase [Bordetella bronchialis]ANN69096.1 CDP-glucose 4,6-dehydratase [Bordetella bronchialis]ANN74244.1 CDP-glucose 4,6-dehydratase [Bordetella bronchialis]
MIDAAFWKGKRVFLTGHTGFKGSWASLCLQRAGAIVTGFALEPATRPSLFEVAHVADGMQSVIGDIADAAHVSATMQRASPDIVIHMAAQALVRQSYADPVGTYATNVMGLVHVLEAVRNTPSVRAFVNVTSDKCYENREWVWGYRENEPMGGHDPYSSSKGCAELITAAYRNSFFAPHAHDKHGVAVASARAGNVIGGGDWASDRLVPDILRAIDSGQPVQIRYPASIRPWQHVLEPISGYLLLAQRLFERGPEFGEAWNFGPDESDARPVSWIADAMVRKWGSGASWTRDTANHPHEATYLKLDCAKAKTRLHWHPRWTLDTALTRIVDWHREWRAGHDMRAVTLAQIERYDADHDTTQHSKDIS